MATQTWQNILDAARAYLNDAAGEIFTNTFLQQSAAEPYRKIFNIMGGVDSKRVQRATYLNFPASTTILIPANYGITDLSEPSKVEERPASASVAITGTSATTPIVVTAPGHGFGTPGSMVEITVNNVSGTYAPWGKWFCDVIDGNSFSLNGSMTDGSVGTGGTCSTWSTQSWSEVLPQDLDLQGLDGPPTQYLGVYIWREERFEFPGSTGPQQLRSTYWASGTAPVNSNTLVNIDNALDVVACATAANAARSLGFMDMATRLEVKAFGPTPGELGGLLLEFIALQVRMQQRGPQRRRLPFRDRRSRWGWLIG